MSRKNEVKKKLELEEKIDNFSSLLLILLFDVFR